MVIEDLAYLGMDSRKYIGKPFEAPYQSTVAHYTDNYMLMLSASKIFSYAGERVATVAISDKLSVVITLALAFLFLHEKFTVKSAVGSLLLLAGTLVMVL